MPRRFPKLPKALLRTPPGYRKPRVADFLADMQRLGEDIAEGYRQLVIENIETNAYGFENAPGTLRQKEGDTPLIDSGELVGSIYRDGTSVSVEDTRRTDSPLTNLELAIVQEYGTADKHVPARPVFRNTYRDYREEAREQVVEFFEKRGRFNPPKKKRK